MNNITDFKTWSKLQGQALKKEAKRNWFLTGATILLSIVSLTSSMLIAFNLI